MNIVAAGSLVGILQVVFYAFADIRMPRSYYLLFAIILIILVFASRYSYRGIRSLIEHVRGEVGGGVHRVMVVGGGAAGNVLIKEIRNSSHIRKKVVCVIDDAQSKIGSYIHGVKIMGNRYEIRVWRENLRLMRLSLPCRLFPRKKSREFLISVRRRAVS